MKVKTGVSDMTTPIFGEIDGHVRMEENMEREGGPRPFL